MRLGIQYLYLFSQAFSDSANGWAIYNGELRHNSNSSGPKYGSSIQAGDIIGVMLDMSEVKLLFNITIYRVP